MTIIEVMLATGIVSLIFSGFLAGSIMLQQQFAASTAFAQAQTEQVRVMDYIDMDLRRATAVTLANGATPLTVTLPDYYQTVNGKKTPRVPAKSGTRVQYNGAATTAVSYSLQGNNLIRTAGGVGTTIATTVQSFPTPVLSSDRRSVTVSLTFSYKMKRSGTAQTVTLTSKNLLRNAGN